MKRDKVTIENQVEQEKDYIVNKLSGKLSEALVNKDKLLKELELEKKQSEKLAKHIEKEEENLKKMLQSHFEHLMSQEAIKMKMKSEQEEEFASNAINHVLWELTVEKGKLKQCLALEVAEKHNNVEVLEV